jgi:hypothetical protein
VLTKGREKSLLRRHPWIFSGAVARMEGKARSGETIDIVDSQENGWPAAPIRRLHRSAPASGASIAMKPLITPFSNVACSRRKPGASGWRPATGSIAIA